jgi:SHS2 domain-containing protein
MYRWVHHTAELELEIESPDERRVFDDAVAALGELLATDESGAAGERVAVEVAVEGRDRATLLAECLTEVLYHAEVEGLVPERVSRLDLRGERLEATVVARRGGPRPLVKGVTYHGLRFEPAGGGWRASVVLDV